MNRWRLLFSIAFFDFLLFASSGSAHPQDGSGYVGVRSRACAATRNNSRASPRPVNVVLAQYHSIADVIRKGNPAGKKDARGPTPPLHMPSWGRELSDADIDALIAYLLSAVPGEQPRGMLPLRVVGAP